MILDPDQGLAVAGRFRAVLELRETLEDLAPLPWRRLAEEFRGAFGAVQGFSDFGKVWRRTHQFRASLVEIALDDLLDLGLVGGFQWLTLSVRDGPQHLEHRNGVQLH